MDLTVERFGSHGGMPVWRAQLMAGDLSAEIISFGAITKSLSLKRQPLVLGYPDLGGYLNDMSSMGIIAGRVGNRIAHGRFDLNGQTYHLETNDGAHHIHGGSLGFGKQNWSLETDTAANAVRLRYHSQHMQAGYPETLDVTVLITLTDAGIRYEIDGIPGGETPVNLLQHSYYNLGGAGLDHRLMVAADDYCPTDRGFVATGQVLPAATHMDFRNLRPIRNADSSPCLIDNNFVLRPGVAPQALLAGENATLELYTDQPGLQVYAGQSLPPPFTPHEGICLEPQYVPNAVNLPRFQSCIHSPDNPYRQDTRINISGPLGS